MKAMQGSGNIALKLFFVILLMGLLLGGLDFLIQRVAVAPSSSSAERSAISASSAAQSAAGTPVRVDSLDGARSRHYYDRLNEAQQKSYEAILAELPSFPERIAIETLTEAEMESLIAALNYDNPDLFYLSNQYGWINSGPQAYFAPQYIVDAPQANTDLAQLKLLVGQILGNLTATMSDYEKELYLHDWLVTHCDYDESVLGAADRGYASTPMGALVQGKAICEGYAKSMLMLMNMADIENFLVTGNATDNQGNVQSHMWNIVTLDGQNYHLDATWDDPVAEDPESKIALRHTYVNMTDDSIQLDHSSFDPAQTQCKAEDFNFFIQENAYFLSYRSNEEARVRELIEAMMAQGGNTLELRFADSEAYADAKRELLDNQTIYTHITKANVGAERKLVADAIKTTSDEKRRILMIVFAYQ